MREGYTFIPARRFGLIFHSLAIVLLLTLGILGMWQAVHSRIGTRLLLYILPSLVAFGIIPILLYQAYALSKAYYSINQEGIRIRWGLRVEDIPITAIEWVHPADGLEERLPMPRIWFPGAVLGRRHISGNGTIDYMAAGSKMLLVVATPQRAFVISPANPDDFIRTYQRCTELGAIKSFNAKSIYPKFFLSQVWRSLPARILLLTGAVLSLTLIVWVSLAITTRDSTPLRFLPDGSPGESLPSVRLLLLPLVNTFIFMSDLFAGMYFFRNKRNQPFAFILWGSGVLTSLLFLAGAYWLLSVS